MSRFRFRSIFPLSAQLWRNVFYAIQARHHHRPDRHLPFATSVFIRHLDCGSCNGCEMELNALTNPVYDVAQYGIHADILAMTGPFTRNLKQAALTTLEAMPVPRIIAIGDCAINGGAFRDSYGVTKWPPAIEKAIIAQVEGCPPSPADILKVLADTAKLMRSTDEISSADRKYETQIEGEQVFTSSP